MQRIQNRFGTAGLVVAIVALFAAMSGGAYAAAHASKAKPLTQAQIIKLIKKYAKSGPAGPQGPAGSNGSNGTNGGNGGPGNDGQSVTVTNEPAGANCATGGKKLVSVSGTSYVCNGAAGGAGAKGSSVLNGGGPPDDQLDGSNGDFYIDTNANQIYGPKTAGAWGSPTDLKGADGSPWTVGGTLPQDATETGTWSFSTTQAATGDLGASGLGEHDQLVPMSFSVPLAVALDGSHTIYVPAGDTSTAHCSASGLNGPGGTYVDPKADSGYLCVYEGISDNAVVSPLSVAFFGSPIWDPASGAAGTDGKAGATLWMDIPASGEAYAQGSWAVTG